MRRRSIGSGVELCIPPLDTFALLSPSHFHCSCGISLDHCCGLEDYVDFGERRFWVPKLSRMSQFWHLVYHVTSLYEYQDCEAYD